MTVRYGWRGVKSVTPMECDLPMDEVEAFATSWRKAWHPVGYGWFDLYIDAGWLELGEAPQHRGPHAPNDLQRRLGPPGLAGEAPCALRLHLDEEGYVTAQEFVACHSVVREHTVDAIRGYRFSSDETVYNLLIYYMGPS